MAYWLDDNWEGGPMIRRAGTAAFGLYTVCGLWIARHTTDGFIPADVATEKGSKEWAAKLVDAGLWAIVEGGFRDLWYLELNPTAVEVEERREKARKRQQRHRQSKRDGPEDLVTRDKTRDSRATDASRHAEVTPPPAQPNPATPTATYVANGRNARAREAAEHDPTQPPGNDPPGVAERVLSRWLAGLPGGTTMPSIVNAVGGHLAAGAHTGVPEATLDAAVALWQSRQQVDRGVGPGLLPSLIHQLHTGKASPDEQTPTGLPGTNVVAFRSRQVSVPDERPSTTDGRFARNAALVEELRAEEVAAHDAV